MFGYKEELTPYLQLDNWVSSVWCRAKGFTHVRGKEWMRVEISSGGLRSVSEGIYALPDIKGQGCD